MVLTAFHAWRSDAAAARWKSPPAQLGLLASVLILVVGVSGSIAALGDTLVQQSITNAFVELLIKLRILHPLIAIAGVASAIGAGALTWHVEPARRAIVALWSLLVLQVIAGLTNVALQAPISMQLVHLLLADAVWVALMLVLRFAVTSSASPATSPAPHPPASALRS
jgi:heme A synthase